VSPAALLNVCRANPRLQSIRAARGAAWSPGAVTQVLAACPELRALELDAACRRVDETVSSLLGSATLRLRSLTALTRMAPATVSDLLAPQLTRSTLRRLVLANCGIGPEGAKALSKALRPSEEGAPPSPLRHLNVYGCGIGASGAKWLAEALRCNRTLRGLDLGFNEIGDEGAIAVARALSRGNATLVELSLSRNGIQLDGAREIAACLALNGNLQILSLADNDFGAAGGKLLAASLRRNRHLQQLHCPGCALGEAGKDFVAMMRESKTLWKVELHNNAMRDDTSRELAVLALQALLKGDPRFDSEEDEAFGDVDLDGEEAAPGDESAHASDSSGSEDGESEDSAPGEPEEQ
jgi:Ran GTPase-activating protein (RanGAP) involved in mRNA processing and transport